MFITLEWTHNGQTHTEEIKMNHIVDFGRTATSHIQLDDQTVSRRHAIIYPYKRTLFLQNVSNTNQIWIDRKNPLGKGDAIALKPGTRFNIGRIRLTVKSIDTALNTFNRRWCMPANTTSTQTPMAFA